MKLTTKLRSLRKKHAELERRYNDTTIPMTEREVHSNLEQRGKIESEIADLERRIDAGEVDEPAPVAANSAKSEGAKPQVSGVTWAEFADVMKAVRGFIDRTVDPMLADIAELKGRPAFSYEGVFSGDKQYCRGNFVTTNGSLWHAKRETRTEPGTSDDWVLAVKKGRDAR